MFFLAYNLFLNEYFLFISDERPLVNVQHLGGGEQRQLLRNINFNHQESSIIYYEDINLSDHAAMAGIDGQQEEHYSSGSSGESQRKREQQRFKPGSTGNRVPSGVKHSVVVLSIPEEASNKSEVGTSSNTISLYNKLGIPDDPDGDRLSPLSAILEGQSYNTSSSSSSRTSSPVRKQDPR